MDNSRPLQAKNLTPAGVTTYEFCILDTSCKNYSQLDRPESPLSTISMDTSLGKRPCEVHSFWELPEICELCVFPSLVSCALL